MNNLISKINILALCIYIYTPIYLYNKQINVALVIGSFLVWLYTAYRLDHSWTNLVRPFIPTLLSMVVINILLCIFSGIEVYSVMVTSVLAYSCLLLYAFYSRHLDLLKWPFLFFVVILILNCKDTIIGNMLIPGVSRKQGEGYNSVESSELLLSMHIGSFPFLYSLALLLLPLTLFYKHKIISRFVYVPILVLFVVTVLYGSYFISLIISIVMIIFGLSNIANLKKIVLVCGLMATIFIVAKDSILDSIIYVGEKTGSAVLVSHAEEIKYSQKEDDADQVSGGRATLYKNAVLNFLDSPIIGEIDGSKPARLSEHSELLEYLEKYGLFSFPFFYIWYLIYHTVFVRLRQSKVRMYYSMYFAVLLIFLLINPLRYEQPLTITSYCIIPLMFMYLDKELCASEL